jgi:hypothetical protein
MKEVRLMKVYRMRKVDALGNIEERGFYLEFETAWLSCWFLNAESNGSIYLIYEDEIVRADGS